MMGWPSLAVHEFFGTAYHVFADGIRWMERGLKCGRTAVAGISCGVVL